MAATIALAMSGPMLEPSLVAGNSRSRVPAVRSSSVIRWLLNGCDYVALGPRGHFELAEGTLQRIGD
jgi:hypothetical protein